MVEPRILFVPVSGKGGAGEYYRCVILADAVRERWPKAHIHFILNREAGYAANVPHPVELIDDSPTRSMASVNAIIQRFKPNVAVFDSSGRRAQYVAAKAVGAAVVYISSRFKTRWKGFRWRRMRVLDQHWLIQPRVFGGGLTWWERLKRDLNPQLQILELDTLFKHPTAADFEPWRKRLRIEPQSYAVFCSGGGGSFAHVTNPAQLYADAAQQFTAETGLQSLVVVGPNANVATREVRGVHMLAAIPNAELLALIERAAFAVINGGSLLPQALALGQACIAAPIAADQDGRIRQAAAQGAVEAVKLDENHLAGAAIMLAKKPKDRDRLRGHARTIGIENGIAMAINHIERCLGHAGQK